MLSIRNKRAADALSGWSPVRRNRIVFIIQSRRVSLSVTEPRPGSMRGIYTLRGTINTLGISLGTGGNLPSRMPARERRDVRDWREKRDPKAEVFGL